MNMEMKIIKSFSGFINIAAADYAKNESNEKKS